MSSRNTFDENPYVPPKGSGVPFSESAGQLLAVDQDVVRRFRSQIHGLGTFWIIVGLLVLLFLAAGRNGLEGLAITDIGGSALVLFVARVLSPQVLATQDSSAGIAAFGGIAILGLTWVALGVLALKKNIAAVQTALVLSYGFVATEVCRVLALMLVAAPDNVDRRFELTITFIIVIVDLMAIAVIRQAHQVIRLSRVISAAGVPISMNIDDPPHSAAEPRNNPYALAGLIIGAASPLCGLSVVIPILGIILSSIGLATFRPAVQKNRWMAFTGLGISCVITLVQITLIARYFVSH